MKCLEIAALVAPHVASFHPADLNEMVFIFLFWQPFPSSAACDLVVIWNFIEQKNALKFAMFRMWNVSKRWCEIHHKRREDVTLFPRNDSCLFPQ